jgi:hypothetical protein
MPRTFALVLNTRLTSKFSLPDQSAKFWLLRSQTRSLGSQHLLLAFQSAGSLFRSQKVSRAALTNSFTLLPALFCSLFSPQARFSVRMCHSLRSLVSPSVRLRSLFRSRCCTTPLLYNTSDPAHGPTCTVFRVPPPALDSGPLVDLVKFWVLGRTKKFRPGSQTGCGSMPT